MENLIRVANVKTLKLAPDELAFYIGRGNAPDGCENAGLGNPFRIGQGYQRGEAAAAYLPWLRERCREKGTIYRTILRLAKMVASGQKIVLVCWCSPLACHGDAIRTAILAYAQLYRSGALS